MVSVAGLEVTVGADISGATKGLAALNKSIAGAGSFFGNAASAALGFGAATIGLNALGGVGDLLHTALGIGLAQDLEELTAQFTAMTGSSAQAEKILADVRTEADATPFAFNELATAASSLLPVAKQSGTALFDLIRPAEILAALRPDQGLGGAAFALREAMGGDWQSIIERFDLPRERLNALKKQGVPAVTAVNTVLREMGATQALVAARAGTTAGRFSTFNDLLSSIFIEAGKPILASFGVELDRAGGIITANLPQLKEFARTIGTTLAGAVHGLGQGLGTWLVMSQNIARDHGLSFWQAGLTTTEIMLRDTFGPQTASLFHNLLDLAKTAGQWLLDNGPKLFDWLGTNGPGALEGAVGKVGELGAWLKTNLPQGLDTVVAKFNEWKAWLDTNIGPIVATVKGAFATIQTDVLADIAAIQTRFDDLIVHLGTLPIPGILGGNPLASAAAGIQTTRGIGQVGPAPTPFLDTAGAMGSGGGGSSFGGGDSTFNVNFNGPVNASTPEDREALAQDIAEQWAAAQARTANAAPAGMPERS
jgi:hypothetical protein